MDLTKCTYCQRRADCALRDLAALTLPWVIEALQDECTDWDRAHAVRRALRGSGCSPGYVEDWKFVGAMTEADVTRLVEVVVRRGEVSFALLCSACRHYLGPELMSPDDYNDEATC